MNKVRFPSLNWLFLVLGGLQHACRPLLRPGGRAGQVRFQVWFTKVTGSNLSWAMLGIYPEIVACVGRSSLRSLAVLAAVWNAKVAGSNPGCVMHVFAKPIS